LTDLKSTFPGRSKSNSKNETMNIEIMNIFGRFI